MGMIGWSNDDGMTNAAELKGNWTVISCQLLEDRNLCLCIEIFLHTHWSVIYAWVGYHIIACIGLHHIVNFFLKSTNQLSEESFLNSDNRLVQEAMTNLCILT